MNMKKPKKRHTKFIPTIKGAVVLHNQNKRKPQIIKDDDNGKTYFVATNGTAIHVKQNEQGGFDRANQHVQETKTLSQLKNEVKMRRKAKKLAARALRPATKKVRQSGPVTDNNSHAAQEVIGDTV